MRMGNVASSDKLPLSHQQIGQRVSWLNITGRGTKSSRPNMMGRRKSVSGKRSLAVALQPAARDSQIVRYGQPSDLLVTAAGVPVAARVCRILEAEVAPAVSRRLKQSMR